VERGLHILIVGEIHRRGGRNYYTRSPLSEPDSCFVYLSIVRYVQMTGRFTGEGVVYTLVLPSVCDYYDLFCISNRTSMSGRFTGKSEFETLVLPSLNRNFDVI